MPLLAIDDHDDAGRSVVVKQVLRQQQHSLDQVLLYERLTDRLFLVTALVPAAAAYRAGVQHHSHTARGFEAGRHVLNPSPIRAGWRRRAVLEPTVGVVLVGAGIETLVPHRI